jgi:putative Mg2+ transporter-C (MgtC) family protein
VSRIAAGVVTGLGFIGAGTIIVTRKLKVKGLTTAAGLWTSGLIGLAVGSGFYEGGILGTLMVILVETYFNSLRSKSVTHRNLKLR